MRLAVVGLGLVSPAGLTSAEHVFFLRAGAPPPQPSPFVLARGDALPVGFCPWLGARASLPERIGALALAALDEAIAPLDGVLDLGPSLLFAGTPGGLGESERASVERLLSRRLGRGVEPNRLPGAAAPFAALGQAAAVLGGGGPRAAVLVAADSLVSVPCLADLLARSPSPWALARPQPAEGAAALVVMDPAVAGRHRVPVLGHVLDAAVAQGASTDDDDEIVDGTALTRLLRAAPRAAPLGAVFGQLEVDSLRQAEWLLAAARSSAQIESEHESRCLEAEIGVVGAASGLMSLVFGLAFLRHGAARAERAARAPFAAWVISRDGVRGLAVAEAAPPRDAAAFPVAMRGIPRARPLPGARFTAAGEATDGVEDEALLFPDDEALVDDDEALIEEDVAPASARSAADLEKQLDALEQESLAALAGGLDDPLARFDAAEPPPMRLVETGGDPLPIARFHRVILDDCVDAVASLARDRALRPARERPATEARILEQLDAIHATGPGCIDGLFRAIRRALAATDPFRIWAPVFALGCAEGGESLQALAAGLDALPSDARAHGRLAAEALALAPHPELPRLSALLAASASPVTRALGVELRARRGAVPPDALAALLRDPSAPVVEAAVRALGRLARPEPAVIADLRRQVRSPDAAVAWQAARVLLLWGDEDPCVAARSGQAVGLGAGALEVFVLGGEADDLPRMQAWLARTPVTPAVLSAIGRFGHAGAWAFLVHHLAEEVLSDAAASALEALFGERVPAAERKLPRAWRAAIAAARLDLDVRYRRGEPWRPEVVMAEWADGALPRHEIVARADELLARVRAGTPVELDGWTPAPEAQLESLAAAVCVASSTPPAGRWR
ncbi:hypothetical protein WME99_25745 [Sorangium sp. So ce136]|uniref:hypothetical protein n=1 Tax=Sorangium sp. So ce136 TaxID=3133284 RepID=UPI003F0AE3F3